MIVSGLSQRDAAAQVPARTLVVAKNIDDIISLDPAQTFEFTGGEILANIYDRLVQYDVEDPTRLQPSLATSWQVGADGKTIAFTLREGAVFASGNPVRPEDVEFSFRRVIRLNKPPAFILAQLGWRPNNVDQLVRKTGPREVSVTITENFSPAFVLNALGARPAAIVDQVEAMAHEQNGDLGNAWLGQNSAGSGAFRIARVRPSESVTLAANPRHFRGAPALDQVILRHVPEPGTQRLLLERGDIDIARDLGPDEIASAAQRAGLRVERFPQATIHFFTVNLRHERLRNPALWEAMRWLVDYDGIADRLLRGQMRVHQAFLPVGFPGALTDRPYRLDVARAREILARAGLQDGLSIDMDVISAAPFMDVAQSIQQTMAQANIRLNLVPGTSAQVITKYRARNHQMMLIYWNPDFMDAHSNAKAFAYNTNNADDAPQSTTTWRNSWLIPELSQRTTAALTEPDAARRAELYQALQRDVQRESPIVIMFQAQAAVAMRQAVANYRQGATNDLILYRTVAKS
ncbi:MAG: ABC transporter substrate-binding protein [Alphaproteobacteria bacterium]|nr:ABC transporter substrate-binding protein [Alphaproteobacteria bacterium]